MFLSINENKSHFIFKHKLIELLIKFFLLSPNVKHVNTIAIFHHLYRAISYTIIHGLYILSKTEKIVFHTKSKINQSSWHVLAKMNEWLRNVADQKLIIFIYLFLCVFQTVSPANLMTNLVEYIAHKKNVIAKSPK